MSFVCSAASFPTVGPDTPLRNPQITARLFVARFQVERDSEFFAQPQGQDWQRVV